MTRPKQALMAECAPPLRWHRQVFEGWYHLGAGEWAENLDMAERTGDIRLRLSYRPFIKGEEAPAGAEALPAAAPVPAEGAEPRAALFVDVVAARGCEQYGQLVAVVKCASKRHVTAPTKLQVGCGRATELL